jgi:hypothetical membrane protein
VLPTECKSKKRKCKRKKVVIVIVVMVTVVTAHLRRGEERTGMSVTEMMEVVVVVIDRDAILYCDYLPT